MAAGQAVGQAASFFFLVSFCSLYFRYRSDKTKAKILKFLTVNIQIKQVSRPCPILQNFSLQFMLLFPAIFVDFQILEFLYLDIRRLVYCSRTTFCTVLMTNLPGSYPPVSTGDPIRPSSIFH